MYDVQDASELFRISWGTVKNIDKEYLKKHYSKPVLKDVEFIAIDEFAYQKGHKYQTVVYDLKAGRVIYVGQGRAEESLDKFFKRLRHSRAKIKAVAMDMWLPYFNAAIYNIPEAKIIFDRFHITKLMNKTMDEVRRALYHDEALQINKPLAQTYYLKEGLGQLWLKKNRQEAEIFLQSWVEQAHSTTIQALWKFAKTLMAHRTGILNWFDYPISTGPLEGFNNKIKVLKRKAYGDRDMEYFALKIYALHENRYGLL